MSKEQYAELHYLLALMKYEQAKITISEDISNNARKKTEEIINCIEKIEKVIFIGEE